jgi:nucleotide-binding universal stress UspA family protein
MSGVIVVGLDGSDTSHAALRWAVEEAGLRGARLVAVHAWSFIPPQPMGDPGLLAMPAGDLAGQLTAEKDAANVVLSSAIESLGSKRASRSSSEPSKAIPARLSSRRASRQTSSSWERMDAPA